MYAREWKCTVPLKWCEGFIDYLYKTGVKDTSSTPGFNGAQIFRREIDGKAEITLITYWDNLASIEAFAGENISKAKLYPEDYKYEIEPELIVRHYEVLEQRFVSKNEK